MTFYGKDINGDIKDIDLSVNIVPLKGTSSHNKNAIGEKVNGKLPGALERYNKR